MRYRFMTRGGDVKECTLLVERVDGLLCPCCEDDPQRRKGCPRCQGVGYVCEHSRSMHVTFVFRGEEYMMPCKRCGGTGIDPQTRDWCSCDVGRARAAQAAQESAQEQERVRAGEPVGQRPVKAPATGPEQE